MEGEPGGWGSGGVAETSTEAEEPRDVRVVRELLRSMVIGDGDYEPRVMHQFLELCYWYVVDVLTDARVYSDLAGKPAIDPDDVRLAIQSKVIVSDKHRAQLTKSMKFKDGYMISSGQPVKEYIDYVVQHVSRQFPKGDVPEWVCNAMEVAGIDISSCCAPFSTTSDSNLQFCNSTTMLIAPLIRPSHQQ